MQDQLPVFQGNVNSFVEFEDINLNKIFKKYPKSIEFSKKEESIIERVEIPPD